MLAPALVLLRFLWCCQEKKPAFPPVLCVVAIRVAIQIRDASSAEGVAECKTEVNSRGKMVDRIVLLDLNLHRPFPTCRI